MPTADPSPPTPDAPDYGRLLRDSGLPRAEARRLMSLASGRSLTWLIAHEDDTPDAGCSQTFLALARRRAAGEPLAYLLGEQAFHGHHFVVSPAVLIPRADTETLVDTASARLGALLANRSAAPDAGGLRPGAQPVDVPISVPGTRVEPASGRVCDPTQPPLRLLDLGTGSGIIAITLALLHAEVEVHAVERSAEALAVARHNADRLGATRIHWHHGSWWDALLADDALRPQAETGSAPDRADSGRARASGALPSRHATTAPAEPPDGSHDTPPSDDTAREAPPRQGAQRQDRHFDLIVSNPPYIAAGDHHLQEGDLRFEPPQALAAGADGLDDLRIIIAGAPAHLMPGGWLLLEHGYDQQDAVQKLLKDAGFRNVFTLHDLAGQPRVSGGTWHSP